MARRKRTEGTYTISVVANQFDVHPQTLRIYEREGLLKPSRTDGNTRLYTEADMQRLEVILSLTRDLGVNLAGVEIILNMRGKMEEMQHQMQEFVSYLTDQMGTLPREPPPAFSTSLIPVKKTTPQRSRGRSKTTPTR
ncbi:MAG: MerR family transcriptional regulator [Solibacterales bacterium]|nr:MerR family transcriptional regulator [Bryobacterales bacterium]|tara:strand:+ start:38922 stop:39335 length:414 start_codon:yes stop_codon:yes gene_type:complete